MQIFEGPLRSLVSSNWTDAVSSGSCLFAQSETFISSENGIDYRVAFSPSLAKKPTSESPFIEDPFLPPFEPHLLIANGKDAGDDEDEPQEYILLLNKFCVSPNHSILATTEFRPQNTPPSRSELYALYSLVCDRQSGFDLAFFNNGPESGASQPHKHYQLLVLPEGAPMDPLIQRYQPPQKDTVFSLPWDVAPYANYIVKMDDFMWKNLPSVAERKDIVMKVFMSLLDRAIQNMRRLSYGESAKQDNKNDTQVPSSSSGDEATIYYAEPLKKDNDDIPHRISALSYNLIITRTYMMFVPRKSEKAVIYKQPVREDDQSGGRYDKKPRTEGLNNTNTANTTSPDANDNTQEHVSVNSLGFVGMVLAKSPSQRDYIIGAGVRQVLTAVCWQNALVDDESDQQ